MSKETELSDEPIYNRLVDFEYDGTKIVPSLAEMRQALRDSRAEIADLIAERDALRQALEEKS